MKNIKQWTMFTVLIMHMETKREIRKRILNIRNALSSVLRRKQSDEILAKLLESDAYVCAHNILCYVDYQSEVFTDRLIETCFATGKTVFVPLVCGENMEFYHIDSLEELVEGYKGIREPKANTEKVYDMQVATGSDLIIMPGAVFDEKRNRIGYGKGFYDRFLAGGFLGAKVALAFELQIVEGGSFETEETDVKPDMIITEKRIIG